MRGGEEGGKCLWWRGWTHEGEGRRGTNACGREGGHMRGSRRRKEKYLWWRGYIRGGGLIKWWRVACGGEGRCTQEG